MCSRRQTLSVLPCFHSIGCKFECDRHFGWLDFGVDARCPDDGGTIEGMTACLGTQTGHPELR